MQDQTRTAKRRGAALILVVAVMAGPVASAEAPRPLTPAALFGICASAGLDEAASKGSELGWRQMTDADIAPWRSSISAVQNVTAKAVGWRRGAADGSDALAFWVVAGSGQHYHACAYTTRRPGDLAGILRERYGRPASSYRSGIMSVMSWTAGRSEISFSQVSATTEIEIVTTD